MEQEHTPRTEAAWKTVEQWMDCVHRRDIDALLLLYCEKDNAFWGTFANKIRRSREEVRTYFDRFLDCESIECRIVGNAARELTPEVVSFTGIYAFHIVKNPGDPEKQASARFTFTLRRDQVAKRWMLVEHHSSLMPETGY